MTDRRDPQDLPPTDDATDALREPPSPVLVPSSDAPAWAGAGLPFGLPHSDVAGDEASFDAEDDAAPVDQPLDFKAFNRRRGPREIPRWAVTLAALVGLTFGPLLAALSSDTLSHGWASRSWPTARGRILATRVKMETRLTQHNRLRREVTMYAPQFDYAFFVHGERFTGSRVTLYGDAWTDRMGEASQATMARMEDPVVQVAYDPANPQVNCLEPGTRPIDWAMAIGAIVLIGGGLFFALVVALDVFVPDDGDAAAGDESEVADDANRRALAATS